MCKLLERVVTPSTLSKIEAAAFRWCGNLKDIVFPESPFSVDADAFKDCKVIELPPNATIITPEMKYEKIRSKFYESFVYLNDPDDMKKYLGDILSWTEHEIILLHYRRSGCFSPDTDDYIKSDELSQHFRKELCRQKTATEVQEFLDIYMSPHLTEKLVKRFVIAALLYEGAFYEEIQKIVRCSRSTISRVRRTLEYGEDGFQIVFKQLLKM